MISRVSTASILQGFVKSRSFLAGNSAYTPPSFESIATATGTGSSGIITFSSIPSTFKHLQLRGMYLAGGSGSGIEVQVQFNNSSAANYADHRLSGNGTAASAAGNDTGSGQGYMLPLNDLYQSANPNVFILDVLDYASTTKNKTVRGFNGLDANGSGKVQVTSGLWINTAAITTIKLTSPTFNFTTSSTFALYGIKEA